MKSFVTAVHISPTHTFSKYSTGEIQLLKGLGVLGDAHCGETIKHRSRLKIRPIPKNLRQVHLIHSELFEELKEKGFDVSPGVIGENITTRGLDLLALPKGAILFIGKKAEVEITGLRNPCSQLNNLEAGLLQAVLEKDEYGNLIRKAGVMGVVREGGLVKSGDVIRVQLPNGPFVKLERV